MGNNFPIRISGSSQALLDGAIQRRRFVPGTADAVGSEDISMCAPRCEANRAEDRTSSPGGVQPLESAALAAWGRGGEGRFQPRPPPDMGKSGDAHEPGAIFQEHRGVGEPGRSTARKAVNRFGLPCLALPSSSEHVRI